MCIILMYLLYLINKSWLPLALLPQHMPCQGTRVPSLVNAQRISVTQKMRTMNLTSDESLDCASGSDFEDMDGGKKDIKVRYALQIASKIDREMINSLLRDNPIAGE